MALKFFFDRNKVYIHPWHIADITATRDIGKIANGLRVKKVFAVIENSFITAYYDVESANSLGRYFLNKIIKDKKFSKKVIDNIYKYSEKMESFCDKIDGLTNIKELSDKKLSDIYGEYINNLCAVRAWGWVPVFLDGGDISFLTDYITREFKKYLEKIDKEDKFGGYYPVLSSSEKESEVQREEIARLNILLKILKEKQAKEIVKDIKSNNYNNFISKFPKIYKIIKKHLKDFCWLTYAYVGPTMTIEHLFDLFNDNLKKGEISRQKNSKIDHYRNIKKEKEKIIKEIALPSNLIYLFEVSSEFMFIKDYRKGIYQRSYVSVDKILKEISRRTKMSLKGVKYLVFSEIKEVLKKKGDHYHGISQLREKKCCYTVINGVIKVSDGEDCEKEIAKNIKKEKKTFSGVKEIKGMTAYGGKVSGPVKIVLVEKDVSKVKEGDILVSSSTNPDLIVAMKRAAAFVTDMGGIISHAAIVSRELKKPCIVGTKEGTHILKDGDIVEVDADNGIVKIIKN